MLVRDTSANPLSATATVTINVDRNTKPRFIEPAKFTFSPSEAVSVYDSLFTVSATDSDSPVSISNLSIKCIKTGRFHLTARQQISEKHKIIKPSEADLQMTFMVISQISRSFRIYDFKDCQDLIELNFLLDIDIQICILKK